MASTPVISWAVLLAAMVTFISVTLAMSPAQVPATTIHDDSWTGSLRVSQSHGLVAMGPLGHALPPGPWSPTFGNEKAVEGGPAWKTLASMDRKDRTSWCVVRRRRGGHPGPVVFNPRM